MFIAFEISFAIRKKIPNAKRRAIRGIGIYLENNWNAFVSIRYLPLTTLVELALPSK